MYLGDEACNINTIDHHHARTFTLTIVHLSTYWPAAAGPCGPLPHSKPPAQPKLTKQNVFEKSKKHLGQFSSMVGEQVDPFQLVFAHGEKSEQHQTLKLRNIRLVLMLIK